LLAVPAYATASATALSRNAAGMRRRPGWPVRTVRRIGSSVRPASGGSRSRTSPA